MIRNSIILTLINLILFSVISTSVFASQLPRYLGNEKKFRAYIYNPNDVYRYIGHYTYQGFIEFGAEESISTISMGDPSLWIFEHLGNRLFLKPVAKNADTNMTIITDKKVYHFELTAKIATSIDDKDLIFVAKFIYPDEADKNILQFAKKAKTDEPDLRNLGRYNFNYEFTGEPNIAPVKVFDDGVFTYMQFSDSNSDLPAIFSVDSSGFEELVNFRVAGDYIIVERVTPQFTLRNGADIVCVYNNNRLKTGGISAKAIVPTQKRISSSGGFGNMNPMSNSPAAGFGANPFAGAGPSPFPVPAPGSAPGAFPPGAFPPPAAPGGANPFSQGSNGTPAGVNPFAQKVIGSAVGSFLPPQAQ